jgi:hypothetical protein
MSTNTEEASESGTEGHDGAEFPQFVSMSDIDLYQQFEDEEERELQSFEDDGTSGLEQRGEEFEDDEDIELPVSLAHLF